MTLLWRMLLTLGLLAEALLFAGVAYAQTAPTPAPTPAPQPQSALGRELAAAGQVIAEASNNTNAIVLVAIAVSIVIVIISVVLVLVLRGILDAQKVNARAQAARDEADRIEKARRENNESDRVLAFTQSVNTFSMVTAGIARIESGVDQLNKDRSESKRRTEERDTKYFERIDTVETRMVDGLNAFGDRLAHEIPQALREGQVQAAQQATQLLLDKLPEILAQVASQPPTPPTPPPDSIDQINIKAKTVNITENDKDKDTGEVL